MGEFYTTDDIEGVGYFGGKRHPKREKSEKIFPEFQNHVWTKPEECDYNVLTSLEVCDYKKEK